MNIEKSLFQAAKNTFRTTNNSMGDNLARDFKKYGNNKPLVQDWSSVLMDDKDLYKGYPYAAINNRANSVARLAKYNLQTDATKEVQLAAKKKEEEVVHPYLKIIDESKTFSNNKFWYDISTYLDLEGVYYLMAVRTVEGDRVGNIQSFKLLNPYEIRRIINKDTFEVGGYAQAKDGMVREFAVPMIIEMRKLNPFNDDDPFSMTDAAKDSQYTLNQAGDYTRHSLKNNMAAPGIISTDVLLDDKMFQNFVSRVTNQEKGLPLFGNGAGAITWDSMQIDLDKAGLKDISEMHRQALFAVSGVGKTMMSIEESGTTRDTSKVQKDLFTENHAIPQLELILDALNQDFKIYYETEYKRSKYKLEVDNPLLTDRDAELKDINIRDEEYKVYDKLVAQGYKRDVAAKFAEGKITLEELGDPTEESRPNPLIEVAKLKMDIENKPPKKDDKKDEKKLSKKKDDGKNQLDELLENLELAEKIADYINGKGYNPNRDPDGKFGTGPRGSEKLEDVIVDKKGTTYYHGTTEKNAKSIKKSGFDNKKNSKGYTEAPYATSLSRSSKDDSDHSAGTYGDWIVVTKSKNEVKLLDGLGKKWSETMGTSTSTKESTKWAKKLKKEGYDGVDDGNGEITLFEPNKIVEIVKIYKVKNANSLIKKFNKKSNQNNFESLKENQFAIINNEYDEESQGLVFQAQGQLENTVIALQARVINDVSNNIFKTQNAFGSREDIMAETEQNAYIDELAIALGTFYGILLPLYGSLIIRSRTKEFSKQAQFKLNQEVKKYIKEIVEQVSKSHINTVLEDIRKVVEEQYTLEIKKQTTKIIGKSGRAVTDADLRLARKRALEGASRARIQNEVTTLYNDKISKGRAKAISRTETNRAFTQSQFHADLQFLRQNGLEDKAYKQWVIRSDNPCPICIKLAQQEPIPFEKNFADLGDELVATGKNDKGKTVVIRQLVNFQPLEAGNAHVNCSCRYKLVIRETASNKTSSETFQINKNENKKEVNDLKQKIKDLEFRFDKRTKEFKELNSKYREEKADDKAYIKALEKHLRLEDE